METNIDHNFRGTPHVHSMFARASSPSTGYPTHVSVLVMDPCVLVNPGFLDGVYKTLHVHQDWVLFSRKLKSGSTDDDGDDDGNDDGDDSGDDGDDSGNDDVSDDDVSDDDASDDDVSDDGSDDDGDDDGVMV